jgi:NADH-quinone oxidoreductase subunit G
LGALTLKSFPFILRGWNVKSYESLDPTDSFGQDTRIYINKNQIVKIEPQFSDKTSHIWLTDKGRQFFDSIFGKTTVDNIQESSLIKTSKQWEELFKSISKTLYVSNICNFKYATRYFFIIVFENVSIEILGFLTLISHTHAFIKIKRAEKLKINSDFETNFQVNSATSTTKLSASSLCLLIGVNPRYEGSYLNLKLRQRYLKGNFKLLGIGSLLDLTFPVSFLGSSVFILKSVAEGVHSVCKDIIHSDNPMYITNTNSLKSNHVQELLNIFKVLKYSNIFNEVWNGSNILNSSLSETGLYAFYRYSYLTFKDLISFSSLYALNVNLNNISNIRIVMESRLLRYKSRNFFADKKLCIYQNFHALPSNFSKFQKFKTYLYLPNSMFFENQETYLNTEGFRKVGSKLIFNKNTKSDWQLLRKFVNTSMQNKNLNCVKENKILYYDKNSLFDFKNFINFHFQATPNLTNYNEYLSTSNQKFVLYKKFSVFKNLSIKLYNTKLKYWLDDFYVGGKDTFCQNSLTLTRCSVNYRLQVTNFF